MNETKENIIEVACQLFYEKGYNTVTVNDICEACNITKTTFYYHLDSKDEIILGYYGNLTKKIIKNITVILNENSYYEQVVKIFDILVDESAKFGTDFMSQMFTANLKEDYGSFNMDKELTNLAVLLIEKAQNNNEIGNMGDPTALYYVAAYAFTGLEVYWCMKKGEFDWKGELHRELNAIFMPKI